MDIARATNSILLGRAAAYLAPPAAVQVAAQLKKMVRREPIEWEYVPEGWKAEQTDPAIKGWNVASILKAYETGWPQFVKCVEGTLPFGVSPESGRPIRTDLVSHNTMMSYAYALTLSARYKTSISMLDWGGGMGHYYLISKALVPDLRIDYHCKDVPMLVEKGCQLFPQAHFYTDDTCLARQFDFVLASSSLHYSQNWSAILHGLAGSTASYLFVTRLPIIHRVPSYVMVQRPYRYGYNTEYLGWCLNRAELLMEAAACKLELVREFVIGEQPHIRRAPEQCEYRGFLFRSGNTDRRGEE
jgi:putative methyltransferase (TIGR04325 family)